MSTELQQINRILHVKNMAVYVSAKTGRQVIGMVKKIGK